MASTDDKKPIAETHYSASFDSGSDLLFLVAESTKGEYPTTTSASNANDRGPQDLSKPASADVDVEAERGEEPLDDEAILVLTEEINASEVLADDLEGKLDSILSKLDELMGSLEGPTGGSDLEQAAPSHFYDPGKSDVEE